MIFIMTKFNHDQRRLASLLGLLIVTVIFGELTPQFYPSTPKPVTVSPLPRTATTINAGQVLSQTDSVTYTLPQVQALSHQDYGRYTIQAKYAVKRSLITYRSYDSDGLPITIYARVYQPVGVTKAPIFGFAPGTTGIGDECAASLEVPKVASWANYESHMVTYAGQGYAAVITDYEGMRDPGRLHHYMVGQLEGRAVLDSVRALINLNRHTDLLDTSNIFLSGYSQGGHSSLWADQIASSYAPELKIKGVVVFAPVVYVDETLADVTQGANLDWFGPYVLVSYADYYHDTYPLASILQPKYLQNLKADVISHCINTDIEYWGTDPAAVYTPQFIEALKTHTLASSYPLLAERMMANNLGSIPTATPKLINGGTKDITILPQQISNALSMFCNTSAAPVHMHEYPGATHYNTMAVSIVDTLQWMDQLRTGKAAPNDCRSY